MEIINELLSDNIDYLNALRNAEALPKTDSITLNLSKYIRFSLIAGALALLTYVILKEGQEIMEKRN